MAMPLAQVCHVAVQDLPFVAYELPQPRENFCNLALVGEAPGADEVHYGRPFVGRSGQLLDKLLLQSGLVRSQCLIANVFRYRPPENKVNYFFSSRRAAQSEGVTLAELYGKFGGLQLRENFACEVEALRDSLMHFRPQVIMALGRTSLWALTGESGLLEKVGQFLPCRLMPGVFVVPTYHPSFILRGNWKLQSLWLKHFQGVRDYLAGSAINQAED